MQAGNAAPKEHTDPPSGLRKHVYAYSLSKTVGLLCQRLLSAKLGRNDDLCCPILLQRVRRAMLFSRAIHRLARCNSVTCGLHQPLGCSRCCMNTLQNRALLMFRNRQYHSFDHFLDHCRCYSFLPIHKGLALTRLTSHAKQLFHSAPDHLERQTYVPRSQGAHRRQKDAVESQSCNRNH